MIDIAVTTKLAPAPVSKKPKYAQNSTKSEFKYETRAKEHKKGRLAFPCVPCVLLRQSPRTVQRIALADYCLLLADSVRTSCQRSKTAAQSNDWARRWAPSESSFARTGFCRMAWMCAAQAIRSLGGARSPVLP